MTTVAGIPGNPRTKPRGPAPPPGPSEPLLPGVETPRFPPEREDDEREPERDERGTDE